MKRLMRGERQMRECDGEAHEEAVPESGAAAAVEGDEGGACTNAQEASEEVLRGVVEKRLCQLFDEWVAKLRSERLCQRDAFLVQLYELAKSFVLRGGKRLRPVACLKAYLLCGGPRCGELWDAAVDVAVAFELLHNSTLVHDDIMDCDTTRRGAPTVWKTLIDLAAPSEAETPAPTRAAEDAKANRLFSSAAACTAATHAILVGNMLVGESMRLAVRATQKAHNSAGAACHSGRAATALPSPAELLAEADVLVNHGQVMDVQGTVGEAEFLDMVAHKTGQLFRCAVLAGAALALSCARATEHVTQVDAERMLAALERWALDVAAAFQLYDDVMDISRGTTTKGHMFASDLRQGKNTLLVSRALAAAPADKAALLRRVLEQAREGVECTERDIGCAVEVLEEYSLASVLETANTLAHTTAIADAHALWPAPCHEPYFHALAVFMVNRTS